MASLTRRAAKPTRHPTPVNGYGARSGCNMAVVVRTGMLVALAVTSGGVLEMLCTAVGVLVVWTAAPRIGVDVAVMTDARRLTDAVPVGVAVQVTVGVGVLDTVVPVVGDELGMGVIPTDALRTGALPTSESREALDSRTK